MNRDMAGPRWGNPTFWVLIALAFGNVFGTGDLGLHRPPAEARSSPFAAHVRSRLWRDPLEVALAATQGRAPEELKGMAQESLIRVRRTMQEHLQETRGTGKRVLVLPIDLRPGPHSEAHEKRLRERYAVTTSLLDRLFIPENPEHLELLVQPHEALGLVHESQHDRPSSSSPYTPGEETPAVAGGNGNSPRLASSTPPEEGPALGDEVQALREETQAPGAEVHALHDAVLSIPYQWFTGSSEADGETIGAVLVTWMDEDFFGETPLTVHEALLGLLLEGVRERDLARVDVRVIGPTTSDGLVSLLQEADEREALYEWARARRLERAEPGPVERSAPAPRGQPVEAVATNAKAGLVDAGAGTTTSFKGVLATLAERTVHVLDTRARALFQRGEPWIRRVGGIDVLSAWSTAELGDAWPGGGARECEFPRSGVRVQRLIGKDRWLADGLVAELGLRIPALMPYLRTFERGGMDTPSSRRPPQPWRSLAWALNKFHFLDDGMAREVRIALVAEEDSLYGRSWIETLRSAWKDRESKLFGTIACLPTCCCSGDGETGCSRSCSEGHACCKKLGLFPQVTFEHIPFLRGIDGYVVGQEGQKASEEREYAAGNGQIDYIRRLQQVLSDGRKYDAIGVMGTDVYDELLILEALRPLFPDTVFFTTDLDVRFAAERHSSYARNLVIASHYGLERRPPDNPEDEVPPLSFRDSYQTSQYEAVGVALAGQDALPPEMTRGEPAYLFEIGRHAAVPLAAAGMAQPPSLPNLRDLRPVLLSLTLIALAFLVLSPISRHVRRFTQHVTWPSWALLSLLVGVTVACGVFLYGQINGQLVSGEPFYLAEGVSVWPAVLIRVAGSTFCLLALLFIAVETHRVQREIERDLMGYVPNELSMWERAPVALAEFRDAVAEGIRTRGRDLPANARSLATRWKRALLPARLDVHGDVRELWRQRYVFWNHAGWRLARAMILTVLFMRLMTPIFAHLGRPGSPTRGEVALLADKGSVFFFVFTLVTLIFYVLDCNWNAIRFLRDHMRKGIGAWPDVLVDRADGVPAGDERSRDVLRKLQCRYLSVQLAADLTQVVQSFVYFPAIGVCIMLASRLNVFDRWAWPTALVLTFALLLGILIVCAWNLSLAGLAVKAEAIRRLQDLRQDAGDDKETRAVVDQRITELRDLKGGAFAPLTQHPLVRAALLPLAFLGSGSILTYWGLLSGG